MRRAKTERERRERLLLRFLPRGLRPLCGDGPADETAAFWRTAHCMYFDFFAPACNL